jgi:hypothetical protein
MNRLDELNIEWIGICNLMQILNRQRQEVYRKWYREMEAQGWKFPEGDFPLVLEQLPSFYHDLTGSPINWMPNDGDQSH